MSPAKHYHTTPPPCSTVGTTHMEIIRSPTLRLKKTRRLEPKTLTFVLFRPKDRFLSVSSPLLLFIGPSKSLLIGVLLVVSLQQFDHEGLLHVVSSEQLMLRCVCYLNSEAFIWAGNSNELILCSRGNSWSFLWHFS